LEPTLMVVGVNHRTAPVALREHFWIPEHRRYEALVQLSQAEGIEEVVMLTTCDRTEFLLWANDVTLAANSVMRLLSTENGLKLCEWKHFYRLLDEAALLHIFRVARSKACVGRLWQSTQSITRCSPLSNCCWVGFASVEMNSVIFPASSV
jgi:glutamyl-tRNA reductase